jgi:hypothetical protein
VPNESEIPTIEVKEEKFKKVAKKPPELEKEPQDAKVFKGFLNPD